MNARAQQPGPGLSTTAEALFQEGKRAMEKQDYAAGCPRLRDSMTLEPGGGVALLLAMCLEQQGKVASAWTAYRTALALAQRDRREDREEQARRSIAALEPRLSRVRWSIRRDGAPQEIRLDDQAVPPSAWGSLLPVDPGPHTLVASVSGQERWRRSFEVREKEQHDLEIPALAPEPPRPPAAAAGILAASAPLPSPGPSSQERLAFASLGASVAALGLGAGFGLVALSRAREADRICPGQECADGRALELTGQARTASQVANVGFGLGLGLGALGGVLLALRPSRSSALVAAPRGIAARWVF
jgi:hypothetical protein